MLGHDEVTRHPALVDPDTDLANGLHFDLVYGYLFVAGDRGMAFSLMLVSAGSPAAAGASLRDIGAAIQRTTRASDLVAHLGEGRFAVILLGTNLPGARIAGDRIEAALAEVVSAPVSIGLANFREEMTQPKQLVEAAERAREAAAAAGGGVEMA